MLFTFTTELPVSVPEDLKKALLSHYFHLSCTCSPELNVCVLLSVIQEIASAKQCD